MVCRKKERGQWRKLQRLLKLIDDLGWEIIDGEEAYAHFHVPSSIFIQSPKTRGQIKRQFCQAWELKTADLIQNRPDRMASSKVVSVLCFPDLWCSQIIIFNDDKYYQEFFNRPEWIFEQENVDYKENWLTSLPKQTCLELFEGGDVGRLLFIGEIPDRYFNKD